MSQRPEPIIVHGLSVIVLTGDKAQCEATVRVIVDGERRILHYETSDKDVGPVSGIARAFRDIVPDFDWADFSIKAVAPGENADAKATVIIRKGRKTFTGQGVHNNTLQATALAIADGLHALRFHEWRVVEQRAMATT